MLEQVAERFVHGAWHHTCAPAEEEEFHLGPYIIGDAAYPESPTMVVPYPGKEMELHPWQRSVNFKHSSTRMAIEQAFGRLKGRWRFLRHKVYVNVCDLPVLVDASSPLRRWRTA